jgi:hypothetical protein
MIRERELDLLIDLLKLLRKYGSESFESLANDLSSPEATEHLSRILAQVPRKVRAIYPSEKDRRRKQQYAVPKSLSILEKTDQPKFQILTEFYNNLVSKKILPSLSNIKQFAAEFGLPEVRVESRQKAINPLINALATFPYDKLKERINSVNIYEHGDRSLEGWGKIILKKKPEE